MAENKKIKILSCPTCGASLKVSNNNEPIVCLFCDNVFVPDNDAPAVTQTEYNGAGNGVVMKVEGLKTPSSALAYMEQFFEEYDWDSFAYAQSLSIPETDKLVSSLKVSSADDKNTWIACFKSVYVPFYNKINGCKTILSSVIEEYKKDSLVAYSKFDAYKRISGELSVCRDSVIENLEKIVAKAEKYGASSDEVSGMKAEINGLKAIEINVCDNIEQIPEIVYIISEKNAKIVSELAAQGINAPEAYHSAKVLIGQRRYVEALNILVSLKGYADSRQIAEKIDKYYLISDALEIEGNLYYFKKVNSENNVLALYPTADGKILNKPIIKSIGNIITNYADVLYYLDGNSKLRKYNLSTGIEEKIFPNRLLADSINVYNKKVYILTADSEMSIHDLVELNLATGEIKVVLKYVKSIHSLTENKMVYKIVSKNTNNGYGSQITTNVLNLDTMKITVVGAGNPQIEGFADDYVVYTREAPNKYNKNLFVKNLVTEEPERLIEQNIYSFCDIVSGKLFYYIGNSLNKSLITVNFNGTGRKEWPRFISRVLFEQGGWLYFIRKSGYNAVLCKSRLDGSNYGIIASDIEEFIEIKNGYLYYINDVSTLVKVRMDGSNLQKLCNNVESVLSVQENKIIFVSIDDKVKTGDLSQAFAKPVKSIYAVEFAGSGKIKLVYNVKTAKEYDDKTVYYISEKETKQTYDQFNKTNEELFRLDVETNRVFKLLDIDVNSSASGGKGFMIAMVVMAIMLFLAFISFAAEVPAFGVFMFLAALVTGGIGAYLKTKEKP